MNTPCFGKQPALASARAGTQALAWLVKRPAEELEKFEFCDYFGGWRRSTERIMQRVSSSDFLKGYGALSRQAQREPVTITNHGRDSLVLISAEEFNRLQSLDSREAYYADELPEEWVEALKSSKAPGRTAEFNGELE